MSTDPASAAKYFVVIDGKPQGPHSATTVMAMWNAGTVTGETLICEEGAAAWSALKNYEPSLRSALPPVPPSGYTPAPPRPAPQPVVAAADHDGTKGLRLGTIVGALILFFVPWLEVSCAGQHYLTQNGVQTVLNKYSWADEVKDFAEMGQGGMSTKLNEQKSGDFGDEAGYSILAGVALLATAAALGVCLGRSGRQTSGVLVAMAFGCLLVQAVIGFPLKSGVSKMMDQAMLKDMPPGVPGNPGDEMAKKMVGKMMLQVEFTPWFYGELVLLGAAAAMGLSGTGAQRR
jgi:hypothetical protein